MMKLPVPDEWTIKYEEVRFFHSPLGFYRSKEKLIVIYVPKWLPDWGKRIYKSVLLKHELGHAWGIKGCWKPWCIVFEMFTWSEKLRDVWLERVIGSIFNLFNGFRFCRKHKRLLEDQF